MISLENVDSKLLEFLEPLKARVLTYDRYKELYYEGPMCAAGFYIAIFDAICLNEHTSTYKIDSNVYSNYVLCHEFIHWTGHRTRMNRKACSDNYKTFLELTAEEKQEEELTADMGALYIHYLLGLDVSLTNDSVQRRKLFMSDESIAIAEKNANLVVHWVLDTLASLKEKAA